MQGVERRGAIARERWKQTNRYKYTRWILRRMPGMEVGCNHFINQSIQICLLRIAKDARRRDEVLSLGRGDSKPIHRNILVKNCDRWTEVSDPQFRIDPKTQDCTVHGEFPLGEYKWHGAVKRIGWWSSLLYLILAHVDQVLKVQPGEIEPTFSLLGNNVCTGAHRTDGKYKFLGGVSGANASFLSIWYRLFRIIYWCRQTLFYNINLIMISLWL